MPLGNRAVKRIQSDSLSAKIADALREAIVVGELRQGDPITQDGVAKEYSVSTMPVREALLMLSHEGMIDARPNRGFRVARMGRQDVEDIYWSHGILAGRLTERATKRLTEEQLTELEQICAALSSALEAQDMESVERFNWQFHRIINLAADSPKVLALLKTTVNQIPKHFYTTSREWGLLSLHDHDELMGALRKRQAAKAEKIAAAHVSAAGRLMVEYLASQGYWDEPARPAAV